MINEQNTAAGSLPEQKAVSKYGWQIPNSYIALDLETTGLNPKRDKMIEIGAVRVEDGAETGRFHTMLNPRRELEERITELTGIRGDMLENAPDIVDILEEFLAFCGELPLLGHRIIFDYSFVKRAAVNQGLAFEKNGMDTLTLCRRFMPAEESKRLGAACAFYGLAQESAHRALGDALDAHRLYQKLVDSIPIAKFKAQLFPNTVLFIGFLSWIGDRKADEPDWMLLVFHAFK